MEITKPETIKFLNVNLHNTTLSNLLLEFKDGALFTPNVDHFVTLQNDKELYEAYSSAEYVVLDSQVIFYLCKIFSPKIDIKEKIAGSDFFPAFCQHHSTDSSTHVFLLGGRDDAAEIVKNLLNKKSQREFVVGSYSPQFGFENDPQECKKIVDMINASGANALAVALGAPKQEKWIYRFRSQLPNVKMFMGVGASFDFMSGKIRRAPVWMQKAGLEWFHRLLQEPRRHFKRYMIKDMAFFYYFALFLMGKYRNPL